MPGLRRHRLTEAGSTAHAPFSPKCSWVSWDPSSCRFPSLFPQRSKPENGWAPRECWVSAAAGPRFTVRCKSSVPTCHDVHLRARHPKFPAVKAVSRTQQIGWCRQHRTEGRCKSSSSARPPEPAQPSRRAPCIREHTHEERQLSSGHVPGLLLLLLLKRFSPGIPCSVSRHISGRAGRAQQQEKPARMRAGFPASDRGPGAGQARLGIARSRGRMRAGADCAVAAGVRGCSGWGCCVHRLGGGCGCQGWAAGGSRCCSESGHASRLPAADLQVGPSIPASD